MTSQAEAFQFVNLSVPKEGKNEDLRRLVRSKAMRSYRQKQKQKAESPSMQVASRSSREQGYHEWTAKRPSESLNAPALVQAVSVEVDREGKEHQEAGPATDRARSIPGTKPPLNPGNLSGGGFDDPFDVYPIHGDPSYNSRMLYHFRFWATRLFPIDSCDGQDPLTTIWLPNAMQDRLLFLATVNYAAVHLDARDGTYNSPSTLVHKAETIRWIKARLKSPTEAVKNTTIGAVAMLAATEGLSRDCKDLRVHMDAIAWMVKKRGGLGELGWSGILQKVISWQDLEHSATAASRPYFAHNYSCQVITLPNRGIAQSNAGFDNTTGLCNMMTAILRDIHYLGDSLIAWNQSSSMNDLISFYDQRSALEFSLTSLSIRKSKEYMREIDYVLESCRIAALIYVKYVLYNAAPRCPILQKLKTQLMNVTLEADDKLVDNENRLQHGSVIWILIMGGILYRDNHEKEYFAQAIARTIRGWSSLPGAKTWEVIEAYLKKIAWVDRLRTSECALLWSRVEALSNQNSSE